MAPSKVTSDIEAQRRELCASFDSVAVKMRECAELASNFSKLVQGLPADIIESSLINGGESVAVNGKRKREPRPKKDPEAPKRPMSAYLLFQNEIRVYAKEQNPNQSGAELMTTMAVMWKNLPPEKKESYKHKVDEDKQRFAREMREYNIKRGDDPDKKLPTIKRKPREKKEVKVKPQVAPLVAATTTTSTESEDDESEDELTAAANAAPTPSEQEDSDGSSSSSGSDDDEDEEPLPKKVKTTSSKSKSAKS